MSANRYIRFVELSSGLIRDSRISLFSSKFSRNTYTQHQLLTLLLLKEYLSEGYRDTVELTEILESLREKIHLDEVNVECPNHYLRVLKGGRLRILIPFARYALQSIERGLGAEEMRDYIFTFVIYIPINSLLYKVKAE
jgi:hypothetical protein